MDDSNRRQFGRIVCARLHSSLGEVPDLSAGGCRIVCKHWVPLRLGSVCTLTLKGDEEFAAVQGQVIRRKRLRFRHYEYGIQFVHMTALQKEAIATLSRITGVKRVMPTLEEAAAKAA